TSPKQAEQQATYSIGWRGGLGLLQFLSAKRAAVPRRELLKFQSATIQSSRSTSMKSRDMRKSRQRKWSIFTARLIIELPASGSFPDFPLWQGCQRKKPRRADPTPARKFLPVRSGLVARRREFIRCALPGAGI